MTDMTPEDKARLWREWGVALRRAGVKVTALQEGPGSMFRIADNLNDDETGQVVWKALDAAGQAEAAAIFAALPDTGLELTTAVVNPLDVDVLKRVLWNLPGPARQWLAFEFDTHWFAEQIAAEYARLTSKEWGTEPHTSPTAEEDPSDPEHAWRGTADEWRHDR